LSEGVEDAGAGAGFILLGGAQTPQVPPAWQYPHWLQLEQALQKGDPVHLARWGLCAG